MYEREEDDDFLGLSALEMPDFLWDDINLNDFCLSPRVAENTPAKDCGEYISAASRNREKPCRGLEEERESSQAKRRRQLFTSEESATTQSQESITSSSENSGGMIPSSNYIDQCQAKDDLHLNHLVPSDDRVDIIGSSCAQHMRQVTCAVEQVPLLASCKIFKGKKSSMKTPMKLTTSIAYPFSPIKPCEIQGEVTLRDINHMIQSPFVSRSNCKMDEEPPLDYSPISGKPVVVKTKIRTEGGKGSITIMRTKG